MIEPRSIMTTAAMFEPCANTVTASALARELADATPADIVREAQRTLGRGRVAVASSFGTESAALLEIIADVDAAMPVLFVDPGTSDETIAHRDTLIARLGLTDVRTIRPPAELRRGARERRSAGSGACAHARATAPLAQALAAFDGWITGRKSYRAGRHLPIVETDGLRLKFNPLAHATRDQIDAILVAAGLPRRSLEAQGFGSGRARAEHGIRSSALA